MANGTIKRYKAFLVENGFIKTYGFDYIEALMAKQNIVCVLLSLVVNLDWAL